MNKENISDIIDLVNEQRDSCGMITREDLIQEINQKLQKAKEQPTKNAEEFYKEWTSICRVYPKKITFCHTKEEMIQFAEEYSNQSKNEIQQRDLTIQELSEQLIESNQSKWISVEDILIQYTDSLRDYIHESGNNLSNDERESKEFVQIFLKSQPPVNNANQSKMPFIDSPKQDKTIKL